MPGSDRIFLSLAAEDPTAAVGELSIFNRPHACLVAPGTIVLARGAGQNARARPARSPRSRRAARNSFISVPFSGAAKKITVDADSPFSRKPLFLSGRSRSHRKDGVVPYASQPFGHVGIGDACIEERWVGEVGCMDREVTPWQTFFLAPASVADALPFEPWTTAWS